MMPGTAACAVPEHFDVASGNREPKPSDKTSLEEFLCVREVYIPTLCQRTRGCNILVYHISVEEKPSTVSNS